MKITVTHSIPDERIQDLLCCALEGGSNYWYWLKEKVYPEGQTKESLKIEFPHLPLKGGKLIFTVPEDNDGKEYTLDKAAIKKGLKIMSEKYTYCFSEIINENEDANTGDIFLQLCLFGKVIYG